MDGWMIGWNPPLKWKLNLVFNSVFLANNINFYWWLLLLFSLFLFVAAVICTGFKFYEQKNKVQVWFVHFEEVVLIVCVYNPFKCGCEQI